MRCTGYDTESGPCRTPCGRAVSRLREKEHPWVSLPTNLETYDYVSLYKDMITAVAHTG